MALKRKWSKLMPWILMVVVVVEITSLLVLDRFDGVFAKSSIRSLTAWKRPSTHLRHPDEKSFIKQKLPGKDVSILLDEFPRQTHCEAWLEEADRLPPGRNFTKDPILVVFGETQDWPLCAVGCTYKTSGLKADGAFRKAATGPPFRNENCSHILRSMESTSYYPENNLVNAHQTGYDIVMTTSLASDVPVGYFSWFEYDIMAPVQPKSPLALAAAFISNCAAHNFRLEALQELMSLKVNVDSFGKCNRNAQAGDKLETLKRYKFSLAFENSNEEDYVTEKFWQSLVAGAVPVVLGPPNIDEFAPAPNSYLHIKNMDDVSRVASQMKYLGSNLTAYNETLRWKYEGPTNQFKALLDMSTVHSDCRLCIHLATIIQAEEEAKIADAVAKRPCLCADPSGVVTYHLYVRERGRFYYESIFLRSTDLTIAGLEEAVLAKFRSINHVPVWIVERPEMIRGDGTLHVYKIYPVGLTQRDALYSVYFQNDDNLKGHLDDNPCPKLEVILV